MTRDPEITANLQRLDADVVMLGLGLGDGVGLEKTIGAALVIPFDSSTVID